MLNRNEDVSFCPLKVSPLFFEKPWGGQSLSQKLNKPIPKNIKIGESWEISGIEPNQTKISDGRFKNTSIGDLCKELGNKILGKTGSSSDFPLLYKFIDAHENLSVQVHPDDSQAKSYVSESRGKTECWYIVDAPKGASIIVGFKRSISKDELRQAITNGSLKELLNEEPVEPGDLLFIPAGTIHAIMANTIIYEVQESSDITFRAFDWNRLDSSGKSRPLHINEAIEATDTNYYGSFKVKPVNSIYENYIHSYRVACKYFAIEQFSILKPLTISLPDKSSFQVITVVNGSITLHNSYSTTELSCGESVLIPACCNHISITTSHKSDVLVSSVPDLKTEIIDTLRNANICDNDIIQLGGVVPHRNDIQKLIIEN